MVSAYWKTERMDIIIARELLIWLKFGQTLEQICIIHYIFYKNGNTIVYQSKCRILK